ncbi:hypothetical protein ONE63_005166 [Megalurothrips usitatus]|uniref:Protein takeout-like n=1 Tax=Megalurothrips usitatus TaxID=439358 RepID=A0AAV7XUL2_9NEOP|nr:hypothetical protein ONE63_005166 [Megalurothrips usitatus]
MRVLLVLCLSLAAAVAAPKSLPRQWMKCPKDGPKVDECLREAVLVAVKDLAENGAKEFGVFPIDPLFMSTLDIEQGSGPVAIDLRFKDVNFYGLKGAQLRSVKADVSNFRYKVSVLFPAGVSLKGNYKINGKVLVLPIRGEGKCDLQIENSTVEVDIIGKPVTKDGLVYAEVKDFKFVFETTRLRLQFENLFNGNKELSAQMNIFLNENWSEILQELKPAIQDAFGAAFLVISNRIFGKVPYDTLFL